MIEYRHAVSEADYNGISYHPDGAGVESNRARERTKMSGIFIRKKTETDRAWCSSLLRDQWGSARVVSRGRLHHADTLPGLIAELQGEPAGLLTYRVENAECEIVTLNSLLEQHGVATALLEAISEAAVSDGCRRLWLITTNDNIPALRFYQKQGFTLAAIYPDSIRQARKLKPEIPELGWEDIPIRDEIEFERKLQPSGSA
jgi:GNAT superfamily N-acetyltransferase